MQVNGKNAKDLVGKYVLRTKPATYPHGQIDRSYMSGTPIKIVEVTSSHIVYEYKSYADSGQMASSTLSLEAWAEGWVEVDMFNRKPVMEAFGKAEVKSEHAGAVVVNEFYYKVMRKPQSNELKLEGPLQGIYPVVQEPKNNLSEKGYVWVQVIDGKVKEAFVDQQIFIAHRKI